MSNYKIIKLDESILEDQFLDKMADDVINFIIQSDSEFYHPGSYIKDIVEDIDFQSKQLAMEYFSKKYLTKVVRNVVKGHDDLPVNTRLNDLSMLEIHLIGYLYNAYVEFYDSDYMNIETVAYFKQEFTKKLNLDYFSDINKYISYSLFSEYYYFKETYAYNNIIYSILCSEFNDLHKQMKG